MSDKTEWQPNAKWYQGSFMFGFTVKPVRLLDDLCVIEDETGAQIIARRFDVELPGDLERAAQKAAEAHPARVAP